MTDPLIEIAREIAAKALRDRNMPSPSYEAIDVEAGKYDKHSAVQSALTALRAQQAMIVEWHQSEQEAWEDATQKGPSEVSHRITAETHERSHKAIANFAYLKGNPNG